MHYKAMIKPYRDLLLNTVFHDIDKREILFTHIFYVPIIYLGIYIFIFLLLSNYLFICINVKNTKSFKKGEDLLYKVNKKGGT